MISEKLVEDKLIHAALTFKDISSDFGRIKKVVRVGLEGHIAEGDFYGIELTEDTFEAKIPQN